MTKDQEIAHYTAFIQSLPRESYLFDMLRGTAEVLADSIRSDIAMPDILPGIWHARKEAQAELVAVQRQCIEARAELSRVQRDVQRHQDALADLRTQAARLARV